jgi:hypothetical protein
MALTIEQLYQQYAGRAPDPEGLAYWTSGFGSTIDPREVEVFKNAIAEARAQGTEPAAAPAAPNYSGGLDLNAGGFQIPGVSAPAPTVKDHRGNSYDTSQLLNLAKQIAPTLDANNLAGGVYSTNKGNIGFAFEDAERVLGYAPTAAEQVVLDMARHLIDEGVTDLSQVQPADQNRRFGATYTGEGGTIYEIQKDPVTGQVRTQTWGKATSDKGNIIAALSIGAGLLGVPLSLGSALAPTLSAGVQGALGGALLGGGTAALTGGNVLQGALLGGAGGYFQGANSVAPGLGAQTDASFLAADAAQLASQGLSESAITQVLGASGYASGPAASLAASMAVNGLDVGMMTQQLDALSTNTGLMSQTGSSADFLAADALQLRDQLGNNFPAIEQNLIASGVDPLIAADISQQLAFNPNLTQTNLAGNLSTSFGNNIYDVNMAQTYPTSVLPGAGGLLSNVPPASNTSTTTSANVTTPGANAGATTGLTPNQIANLIKAGVTLAGTTGVVNAVTGGGGTNTPLQAPTQGVPTNDPNYYNQLQQYYNAYLPQTPRDVVTPLQQWYNSSYGA